MVLESVLVSFFYKWLTSFPSTKHLLISWLQSPSTVILKPKNKVSHCFHCFPICHEVIGPDATILVLWMLSCKPTFSLSSFTLIKRHFTSFLLSAIRMVSSAYLRFLIFLTAILISACASSSPTFLMMYSACKLNKQGDNIQPWCTPFPIWNQSVVPCSVLTVASWPAYRFLRRHQVVWHSHLFKNFPQFIVIHTVKGFDVINKAEVDVFLVFSFFFYIQWMLAIWSLVPLPLLKLAWTSGSS